MIFLSLLAKTFALALARLHPWLAAACWTCGAALDWWVTRKTYGDASMARTVGQWAWLQLAALVIGWAALDASEYAAIRWKEGIPVLASMVASVLSLTGIAVGNHGGLVYLTTMAGPLEYATSIDHLALKVPWLFWALSGVWLCWAQASARDVLRKLGWIAGILLVAIVVRGVCQVLVVTSLCDFVGYESEELPFRPFMDETALSVFYLPFLLAAGVLLCRWLAPPAAPSTPPRGVPRALLWAGPALLLVLAAIMCWEPLGTLKTGKVVICTYHTQWSPTARPYDREWYGADSGYNYACMKRFLGLFYPVAEASGTLVAKDLEGASSLVIYLPDRRFSSEEIELIRDFVRGGGGLFVIGDHTNVFGSTSHINELCVPFGFQFRDDVLFDLDEDFHQMMYPPQWPSQFWYGMSLFKLRGPTSIRQTAWSTRCTYQVGHSKGVRAIYSVNNFYPPPHDDPKMSTGTYCVSAASRYGRGRVVAWADSTVFSNFEIFYPGKYELLLNSLNWLNHQDGAFGGVLRRILPILALAGLAIFCAWRRQPRVWLATSVVALACLGVARSVSWWQEQRQAAFPKLIQPSEWVVFGAHAKDPGHNFCGFVSSEPYDQRYEVFIQWALRNGAYPGFQLLDKGSSNGLYQHLRASDTTQTARALIVRKPSDLGQLDELAAVPARAKDPLLVMFASTIPAAKAVECLKRSGLVTDADVLARVAAAWPNQEVVINDGERRLMVVAGAERFSDQAMGISEKVVPDAAQRNLFNQAFGVIDRLFGRVAPTGK